MDVMFPLLSSSASLSFASSTHFSALQKTPYTTTNACTLPIPLFLQATSLNLDFSMKLRRDMVPVWVANRENPIVGSPRSFCITADGNLKVLGGGADVFWWTNVSTNSSLGTYAKLLDSGHLMLVDADSGTILWQSFDDSFDTLLPSMKIGIHVRTSGAKVLRSWYGSNYPYPGRFMFGIDPLSLKQFLIWQEWVPYWSSDWNGSAWDFVIGGGQTRVKVSIISTEEEIYFTYSALRKDVSSWVALNYSGVLQY